MEHTLEGERERERERDRARKNELPLTTLRRCCYVAFLLPDVSWTAYLFTSVRTKHASKIASVDLARTRTRCIT